MTERRRMYKLHYAIPSALNSDTWRRGALVKTFGGRRSLRNWLALQRLDGRNDMYIWAPAFPLDVANPRAHFPGTNIRKEES